jgi:hypothetical protein
VPYRTSRRSWMRGPLGRRMRIETVPLVQVIVLSVVTGTACGKPLFTPPSRLEAFDPNDPIHEVVGRWRVEFVHGDAVARGELELTDSVGSPIDRSVVGSQSI